MSYRALYRKYRPSQFKDVVGQEHITQTLKNVIENDKTSHAYLFAGPRGTGKTSVAKIFAKCINCMDKISKTKICGKCETCLQENNIDIVEIDAASNNGVAEVRSIINNVRYAPSISKYKIYIIDEVHMLSKGAFNALLKTLEEPPAHVIFILATTEPHKIPVTILSRTQRFNFKRILPEAIVKKLAEILEKENIKYEEEALKIIAKMAKGGMRDAISITDQASSYTQDGIFSESVSEIFGILSYNNIISLINNIYASDIKKVLEDFNKFIINGYEANKLVESIINSIKDFIIYKKVNDLSFCDSLTIENINTLKISIDFAYEALEIFIKALSDIKISEMPTQVLELSLLKASNLIKSKKDDIFTTSEINVNKVSNETNSIFKEEEPKSIQDKIDKTMELTINQEIHDDDGESKEIEEEILNQESFKSTDELNISSLFSKDDTREITKENEESTFTVDQIINLLIQANKNKHIENKEKWSLKNQLIIDADRQIMHLFDKTNLISSSHDFLLLESDDTYVIKEINRIRDNQKALKIVAEIVGEPASLYAITKDEFEKVKSTWIDLSQSNTLPKPIKIEKPTLEKPKENEAKSFGTSIFGDIFD